MTLSIEGIQKALNAPFFFLNPLLLAIIEEATKKGYLLRISHTQAQWSDEGLEKARVELAEKEPVRKGLIAEIYRADGRTPNQQNMLYHVKKVVVVGPMVPEIFEATDEMPAVEVGHTKFQGREVPHLKPAGMTKWFMFGGDLIYSSDSRFTAHFGGPMKLHDRVEE